MQSYEQMKNKWRRRLEEGTASYNFSPDELAPGKFCVLYSDFGTSGTCCSATELIGFFDNARDFLAFIRHAELPRILDYATGTNRDVPDVADAYLLDLEDEPRNRVDRLLGLIDRALKAPMISESELSTIFTKFNTAFSESNPAVQVLGWGSLADVLASSALAEALEEAIDEEVDDVEQPCTQLRALLATRGFSENSKEHLTLAKGFLEKSSSF